jgi:hypothetical protein
MENEDISYLDYAKYGDDDDIYTVYSDDTVYTDIPIRCNRKCVEPAANALITQKRIQNVVRVPSSLYTMNIGALNAYQPACAAPSKVTWNQMSDRVAPAVQTAYVSFRSSKTLRPGALTPGGVGCDIKHNSYERRLLKLKGGVFRNKTVAGGCV